LEAGVEHPVWDEKVWAAFKTVLLETRRRDGSWVATPVSLVVEDGHAFFRTYDASGKAKRLRNFAQLRISPSSLRGKRRGAWRTGTARMLTGADAEHARDLLAAKYPVLHRHVVPWMHRKKGWTTLHYELELDQAR
jgi:PPOX class probable F420-dependent enzyme